MGDAEGDLVAEQIAYYDARAREYDAILRRSGSYLGARRSLPGGGDAPDDDEGWYRLERILHEMRPTGEVLELACGTGAWTERLALTASSITAVDASPASIELNRRRVSGGPVEYVVADILAWEPPVRYDFVFFGFWLSHVPPSRFEAFFELVRRCLEPDGRVLFFDEMHLEVSDEWEQRLDETTGATRRVLEDGRSFRMVKVYHEPAALQARLHALGWDVEVGKASSRFLFGRGRLRPTEFIARR